MRRQLASYEGYEELEIQRWRNHTAAIQNEQTIVELRERYKMDVQRLRGELAKERHELACEINKDVIVSEEEQKAVEKLKRSNRALKAILKRLKNANK